MRVSGRDPMVIWVLPALCIALSISLAATVVNSNAVHPRRGTERYPSSAPTSSQQSATATPSPSVTPAPNQGGGSGGGTGTGGGTNSGGGTGAGGGSIDQPTPSYAIGGTLTQQLHPGDVYPLDLSLTNLGGVAMMVIDLQVTISHVAAPNATASRPCTVNDFGAVQVADGFSVALGAYESTSLSAQGIPSSQWPQIRMLNTAANQDGCKGATLTLSFTGSSTVTP